MVDAIGQSRALGAGCTNRRVLWSMPSTIRACKRRRDRAAQAQRDQVVDAIDHRAAPDPEADDRQERL